MYYRTPAGHPPLVRGAKGGVKLALNQVWVQRPGYELWVLTGIERGARHPSFPHRVTLVRYRGHGERQLAEASMRQSYGVWEAEEETRRELNEEFDLITRFNSESPWRGASDAESQGRWFFGMDQYGNRAELVEARSPKPAGGPPRKGSAWRTRSGRSTLFITRHWRERGEKLWLSVSFPDGGFGVMEYDARRWHKQYVKIA